LSALLVAFGVLVAILLGALLWSSGRKSRPEKSALLQSDCFTLPCQHVANLPQMRQSLEATDMEYLTARCTRATLKRVQGERRRVVLFYLEELRGDFDRLMEATTRVAVLSPEIEAKHEWRRFRLSLEFRAKCALLRVRFAVGVPGFSGLGNIASMVSKLAIELDRAMTEIAAAAALADTTSRSAES
jgi:hypothetical protein